MSIKVKVTLWYTLLMAVLVALVAVIAVVMSTTVQEMSAKKQLEDTVNQVIPLIEYDGSALTLAQADSTLDSRIYLLFYDEHYAFLAGSWPRGFPDNIDAADTAFRTIEQDNVCYYVYDRLLSLEAGAVWLRSIYTTPSNDLVLNGILRGILCALPLLVLLSALGGWLITREAFRIVDNVRQQAEHISSGQDLSLRLPLTDSVDELYHLSETLNGMFDRLEQSFQAEQQFISDISHELRTPTAVILAECEYALHSNEQTEQQKALVAIERQSKRMSHMISEMLTLSRMERGQTRLQLESIDFTELVEIVCEDEQEILPAHLSLQTDLVPVTADVHQDMMIRLLTNLLSNAVRYAQHTIIVRLQVQADTKLVTLVVHDDGAGIPPEEQSHIFRRFYQSDTSRSHTDGGGLGLGLAMCEQIAHQHAGQITLQSSTGEGTSFVVTFPQNQKGASPL